MSKTITIRIDRLGALLNQEGSVAGVRSRRLSLQGLSDDRYAGVLASELSKMDGFGGDGSDMDIYLLGASDIPVQALTSVASTLSGFGFPGVTGARHAAAAAGFVLQSFGSEAVVTVETVGNDVYVNVFKPGVEMPEPLALTGMGSDPRAEALVEKMWSYVRDKGIDLKFEKEAPLLRAKAVEFLTGNLSEVEEEIMLSDGIEYDYFLSRDMLGSIASDDTSRLLTRFADHLALQGVTDRSRVAILLIGDVMANNYVVSHLTPGFGLIQRLEGALHDAFVNYLVSAPAGTLQNGTMPGEKRPETVKAAVQDLVQSLAAPRPATPQTATVSSSAPADVQSPANTQVPDNIAAHEEKPAAEKPARIDITTEVQTVKTGLFSKKKVLKVRIDSPELRKLKWHSVLCIQEQPFVNVNPKAVAKDYGRDSELPFNLEVELPFKNAPNAKKLRLYFKPHPNEPVGINAAYSGGYVQAEV